VRSFGNRIPRATLAAALTVAAGVAIGSAATSADAAVAGCSVSYALSTQWDTGFTASVTITNLGDPLTSWSLGWSFAAGQQVTSGWNAIISQSGAQVTAGNQTWNGSVATGATVNFGFNGSWTGSNPAPTAYTLNGVACSGSPTSPTPTTAGPTPTTDTGSLPTSFRWQSGGPLIGPRSDATHSLSGIKDPSVVFYNGRYHLFASTTSSTGGYSMVYLSFTDWAQAGSATQYYLDQSPIGTGYRAAPEIFYFAPQNKWYLVYQTGGNASYSTNTDISNPAGWTAPRGFYAGVPAIVQQNIGSGYWVDMWVICDTTNCYLFSSDDNGHLYRSQTSVANFPAGMSEPVIALQDADRHALFEASNVYQVAGTGNYLLIVEAIGSGGKRYFRSWTSTSIAGTWNTLAATEASPFAGTSNVTFTGTAWTTDISHGEMIRTGYDQKLTISACSMRYVYQGRDPSVSTGSYSTLPWRLALLTQTNSTC